MCMVFFFKRSQYSLEQVLKMVHDNGGKHLVEVKPDAFDDRIILLKIVD